MAGPGAVERVTAAPGVETNQVQRDRGEGVFEVCLGQAAVAGASHAGDRHGLVDGALDAGTGAVLGAPLLAGLFGAGLIEGFLLFAGLEGKRAASGLGAGALVTDGTRTGHAWQVCLSNLTTIAGVPRWLAGLHQALVLPRGQTAWRLSQSMVKAVRSNPAPARAWGELFSSTGVTRTTPKLRFTATMSSADG